MKLSLKVVTNRANKIAGAWQEQATDKTINSHTVASFEVLRTAVTLAQAEVTKADAHLTDQRSKLQTALAKLNTAASEVVAGVQGDNTLGGRNGSLYESMGYTPAGKFKSGLTRKSAAVTTTK